MGWKIAIEGRKNFAASALYDAAGALIGAAKTLWIELRLGGGA
jgi:hypothetical protein